MSTGTRATRSRTRTRTPAARAMPWSISIGRAFGIPIRLHATFVVVAAFITLNMLYAFARGIIAWDALFELALAALLFASVVAHELGHALVAKRYGITTQEIVLFPIGGVARIDRLPDAPKQEIAIALAGPLVSFGIGALGFLALFVAGITVPLPPQLMPAGEALGASLLASVAWMNIVLGAFNLVPAFPMDGGRVLRAVLAMRLPHANATIIAGRIGQGCAFLLGLVGMFTSPMLIVIAFFVFFGATSEMKQAEVTAILSGLPARAGMMRDFTVLRGTQLLSEAVTATLGGSQRDFPVVDLDESRVVGVLTYEALLRGLAARGPDAAIASAMATDVVTAAEEDPLTAVLGRMGERDARVVVVHDDAGRATGLIVPQNLTELIEITAASKPMKFAPAIPITSSSNSVRAA